MDDVIKSVHSLRKEFELHLMDGRRGERLREGVHVAIIGEPNVGKSSILNALCGRPAAIVSPAAGTTRDIVESAVNLGGYPVLLSDTAGLRDTTDGVEQEGVRRAKDRAVHADIRVIVIDARKLVPSPGEQRPVLLDAYLGRHLAELGFTNPLAPGEANTQAVSVLNTIESGSCREQSDEPLPVVLLHPSDTSADPAESILVVFNKCDLVDHGAIRDVIETRDDSLHWTCLSCVTEEGMGAFTELLTVKVKQMCGNPSSGKPSLTQSRHRHHLEACLRCLDSFLQDQNADLVVAGEHLRRAVYQMGKLTGKITSDEILDVVFRDFCIGK